MSSISNKNIKPIYSSPPTPSRSTSLLISFTFLAANVTCDSELGWKSFNKSCYNISEDKKPWDEAKRKCGELGGHLLKIDDQTEQEYFKNQFKNMKGSVGKHIVNIYCE